MPIIFYGILLLTFLFSLRNNKEDGFLDKKSCDVLKGFFILLIVFSHILITFPYTGFMGTGLYWFRTILGQLIVSMFFFISGYGIIYSVETKGSQYSKSIITNRFLRIFIYTLIGLIPFFIYSAVLSKEHSVADYFLALIGLQSFGNETWFLFAILVCYLLCSLIYFVNWKNKYIPIVLISTGIITYIFIMFFLKRPASTWNTIVCFIYGMFIALFREKINSLLSRKKWISYALIITSLISIILLQYISVSKFSLYFPGIISMWFSNFIFCVLFVALTKVFTLKSVVLTYLGKASFAIFIGHRLVICCFTDFGPLRDEWLNYFVIFLTSPLIGLPIFYLYKISDKFIINPIVQKNRALLSK